MNTQPVRTQSFGSLASIDIATDLLIDDPLFDLQSLAEDSKPAARSEVNRGIEDMRLLGEYDLVFNIKNMKKRYQLGNKKLLAYFKHLKSNPKFLNLLNKTNNKKQLAIKTFKYYQQQTGARVFWFEQSGLKKIGAKEAEKRIWDKFRRL